MSRRALVLLAGLLIFGVAVPLGVLAFGRDESAAATYRGSVPPPGIHVPDFSLPDVDGRLVRMTEARGKVVLVTFLDTQCAESCPVIASQIALGLDRLNAQERSRVSALALSVDPDEDTPASVRDFLAKHRAEEKLRYIVAPVPRMRPVWSAFNIAPSLDTGSDNLHSSPVRIYDPRGIWVSTLHAGVDLTPQSLVHDLRVALEAG